MPATVLITRTAMQGVTTVTSSNDREHHLVGTRAVLDDGALNSDKVSAASTAEGNFASGFLRNVTIISLLPAVNDERQRDRQAVTSR